MRHLLIRAQVIEWCHDYYVWKRWDRAKDEQIQNQNEQALRRYTRHGIGSIEHVYDYRAKCRADSVEGKFATSLSNDFWAILRVVWASFSETCLGRGRTEFART